MKAKIVHALLAFVLVLAGLTAPLFAHGFPANCAGTYLTQEGAGARDFWTLEADGTFFGTTSTQPLFNFSSQQGTWKKDGNEGAKGILLAFVFDDDKALVNIARIDISLETVGNGCNHVAGSLEVRLFATDEDPLGPGATSVPPAFTDTFTGNRVR
ncbi:MAG: hypothetical protein ABJC13_18370 [Acidobacteriota bacterium]